MSSTSDPTSFLTTWVQRDKKLITYRLLSRELRIHVDDAKKALATFFDSHKDNSDFDATYVLVGRSAYTNTQAGEAQGAKVDEEDSKLVGSSSTASSSTAPARSFLESRIARRQTEAEVARQVIRLVSADQLEEAKSSLEEVTSCHIYSISPGRLRDAAQLTAVQYDLHSQQKYADVWRQTNRGADLGVIINPNIKDNYDPSKAIPSLAAPIAPAISASKDSRQAKGSTVKSQVKDEPDTKPSATTAKSTPSAPASGKKSGLDWSRAKPKEAETKAAVKKETPSLNKRSSARKALLGSDDEDDEEGANGRKPISIDDEDDEDDDKPEKLGYADDESDDGDIKMADPVRGAAPRGTGKRADARSQTKAQEAAQRKELEAMMDSDDDDVQVVEPSGTSGTKETGQGKDLDPDVEMADSTVTDTMNGTEPAPAAAAAAKRRVRKKRKIGSKKVRTKDERGYTVTKTVDEYESYSSEESDAPVVVGSKRGGGAAKQQSKAAAESRSTSTSASASPAPSAAPAKSTPASNNSSANRKPSGGATPTPAKKGQQSLNSFFTRKPK
ncbi:uncharacterized protein UTRI_04522_B [Ustilago trichophora]|uniref:DNA polymerase delta subunit 3 n=1 Tax=Ustilago trichophora TaxID=86804 RepID=A0A5C3EES1_9BASI|nr:uncharacterized protein UTRI_04522_B [Ustilago trichophora]